MILKNPMKFKIYLYSGYVDMRRSWSLYDFIKGTMNRDPLSESLFLFSGRSRKLIKVFYWDGNGFCIWQKKLERGRFGWVSDSEKERTISPREMKWLLSGIDFRNKHKELFFLSNK
jgi:transposase